MPDEAASIVEKYFQRMQSKDKRVFELFDEEATLVGLGGVKQGREAIADFYSAAIEGASPSPSLVGDLLVSGDRVAAEIEISLADGSSVHAVDLFRVNAGRIQSLTYFIADH